MSHPQGWDRTRPGRGERQQGRLTAPSAVYSPQLHHVKALFLQKQYRQCIQLCRGLMATAAADGKPDAVPLHTTFVNFYLGLAHDELARAMHAHSHAKIPAFRHADRFYNSALDSLPPPEQASDLVPAQADDLVPAPVEPLDHDSYFPPPESRSSSSNSLLPPQVSPPRLVRNFSLPSRSAPSSSPEPPASDVDELESHNSYSQIMTPNRVQKLVRDYSSMSLLQLPPRTSSRDALSTAKLSSPSKVSQSIQHLQDKEATAPPSRLPRLNIAPPTGSTARRSIIRDGKVVTLDSPVSPLDPRDFFDDARPVSPVSPRTPVNGSRLSTAAVSGTAIGGTVTNGTAAGGPELTPPAEAIEEHLRAMRVQLLSHITLLHQAEQQALDAQARGSGRASRADSVIPRWSVTSQSKVSGENTPPESPDSLDDVKERKTRQNERPASFAPEDNRLRERKTKVLDGRGRRWERKRFVPERYRALAEMALAEL